MLRFLILLNGTLKLTKRFIEQVKNSRIIAVDGGIRHASYFSLLPELWVGDFDSVASDFFHLYDTVEKKSFSRDKDKTDGEIAVEAAIERGATEIILAGAFGGDRIDHILAHATMAIFYGARDYKMILTSGLDEAMPILPGTLSFSFSKSALFSILPFSDLEGLSIKGAKWNLNKEKITFGDTRCLSNIVSKKNLDISLETGCGIIIFNHR